MRINYWFKPGALLTSLLIMSSLAHVLGQTTSRITAEDRYQSYLKFYTLVRGTTLHPHWYGDGDNFWFAGGTSDSTVIYTVDPKRNTQMVLFENRRLRAALKQALGHEPLNRGIPFTDFQFDNGTGGVQFILEGKTFVLNLNSYQLTASQAAKTAEQLLSTRDHNLWLDSLQLTKDGVQDYDWMATGAAWSPDGSLLFVQRSDVRKVHQLPIIDYATSAETVVMSPYAKTGGALEITELFVIDPKTKGQVKIDVGKDTAQYIFPLGWLPNGTAVLFMRLDRVGKILDLLAADPHSGASRVILSEQNETFVAGLDFIMDNWRKQFTLLNDGKTFIWLSERDGWKHLYLYSIEGNLIRRLTIGSFPVIEVIKTDEKAGYVYFTANAQPDLYATNLYRVSFDGKRFKRLTLANGPHDIRISPSGNYFLDTHSTPGNLPSVDLRSTDGRLLQTLRTADTSQLAHIGYHMPESFVVKAADDSTDIYGILYKPFDFDPRKKYPVVEFMYAGPFTTIVPHGFMPGNSLAIQAQALAQLGYITFLVDSRGTTGRSKAFQDIVYGNIGKYEIPDHVAALRQLASTRPYMDLNRVGIYGHSWGGYFALRAMLTAPDIYRAGIASAPGELTEGAEINEPYMGLPKDNPGGFAFGNNSHLAGNLKGKLFLIHGTGDTNAPLSTTIRMIDALIKAGKPYDLLLLPGQDHFFQGVYDDYSNEAIRRYFDENLKQAK
jgi:dienelactone hydrolase